MERGDFGSFDVTAAAEWSQNALLLDETNRRIALINALSSYGLAELPPLEEKRTKCRQFVFSFEDLANVEVPKDTNHGQYRFRFVHGSRYGEQFGDACVFLPTHDADEVLRRLRGAGFNGAIE